MVTAVAGDEYEYDRATSSVRLTRVAPKSWLLLSNVTYDTQGADKCVAMSGRAGVPRCMATSTDPVLFALV